MVDLECPGNTCEVGRKGKRKEPVTDRINAGSPGFQFVLADCEKGKTDP